MKTIHVHQQCFFVEVKKKPSNKKIYLRLKNGIVFITSPVDLSDESIIDIIRNHFHSIMKLMPKKSQLEEEMHFLGKKYPLKIVRASFDRVQIEEDTFVLYASKTDAVSLEKLTALFYNAELKKIVAKYLPVLQKQFEIKEPVRVCYKNVKSYFGECFPKKKTIILASRLAKYDLSYILSVLYHEFAHFKYPHHQKEFYDYLESFFPNYKAVQHRLRSIYYQDRF